MKYQRHDCMIREWGNCAKICFTVWKYVSLTAFPATITGGAALSGGEMSSVLLVICFSLL